MPTARRDVREYTEQRYNNKHMTMSQ